MTDEAPTSWRTIRYGTPVVAADGSTIGTVAEVLGSDAEDIFHGIRLRLAGGGDQVVVLAAHVTTVATDRVATDLAQADVSGLPSYNEEATYHLASVGWLRRHLAWVRDSEHDEEPG